MWGRFGHGMGLSMAEAVDVMRGDDNALDDGHCLELHAGVKDPRSMQSVLIGEQYMIEGGRAVPLSQAVLPLDLGPAA
jgi:hypothetical protein